MATIGISISDVNTVAEGPAFKLGTKGVLETEDGTKEYVYCQNGALSALSNGTVVIGYGSANAVSASTDALGNVTRGARVGVAVASVEVNQYFWMQVYGRSGVFTLASFAAGAKAYVTATAGAIDDAATAGLESIDGIFIGTATGGATALNTSASLNYPSIGNTA